MISTNGQELFVRISPRAKESDQGYLFPPCKVLASLCKIESFTDFATCYVYDVSGYKFARFYATIDGHYVEIQVPLVDKESPYVEGVYRLIDEARSATESVVLPSAEFVKKCLSIAKAVKAKGAVPLDLDNGVWSANVEWHKDDLIYDTNEPSPYTRCDAKILNRMIGSGIRRMNYNSNMITKWSYTSGHVDYTEATHTYICMGMVRDKE